MAHFHLSVNVLQESDKFSREVTLTGIAKKASFKIILLKLAIDEDLLTSILLHMSVTSSTLVLN